MKLESLPIRLHARELTARFAAPRCTNKWSIAAAAVVALVATPAAAADLAFKASPGPEYSWTGCYAGIQGGGTIASADGSGLGVFAGGQFGCNYQAGHYVFGVEVEAVRSTWTGHNDTVNAATSSLETIKSPWNADLAVRAGYAFPNDIFAYLKFGATFASLSYATTVNSPFVPAPYATHADVTMPGYLAGLGVEAMLTPRWIARMETDFTFYSSDVTTYCAPAAACVLNFVAPTSIKTSGFGGIAGKLGISYKFF